MTASGGRPRVLFVGATRYDLPLSSSLAAKWDALAEELDLRVLARRGSVERSDPRFELIDAGPGFYARLPFAVAREIRRHRPQVVISQSPFEAFACLAILRRARPRPKLVIEVHGDWRTAARMYGSAARRALAALSDRAAGFALRRADATRAISAYTHGLATEASGRPPLATFPTYFDMSSFTARPPLPQPERPAAAWIGVLERYKDPATLAQAWRIAAPQLPEAQLAIVGRGPERAVVDDLVADVASARAIERLEPAEVAQLLDESTVLAMSSAAEGLGRVIMEAFLRGRPVIATAVGGIPDLVTDGHNGLLVPPGRPQALAAALIRVLGDPDLAARLAKGALEDARRAGWRPESYAAAVRELVDRTIALP